MRWGKKNESRLGVILTAILCGGFLYVWFQPRPQPWQNENASQLVSRAMKEPMPDDPIERHVLDFDLMETAICQGRAGMLEEAVATAKHIAHPVIRMRAVEQLAQTYLNSDPQDFGEALALAELVADPAGRAAVRTRILGQLAVLGFADAAVPEAKTARQKALLAKQMSGTDDKAQTKARELMAAAEKELPNLSPEDAAAVREDLAGARINLTPADGPDPAIAAIRALPEVRQSPYWKALADWCDGEKIDLRTILPLIPDAGLRRKLEIDSLLYIIKPWPAAELIAKYRAEAAAAASPEAKVDALIATSEVIRNSGEPDANAAATEANRILREARAAVAAITDPAVRCRALLGLTKKLNLGLLFDDAISALGEAMAAARAVPAVAARVPLLIAVADESFLQSMAAQAETLITEAAAATATGSADAATMEALAVALVKRGDWVRAFTLVRQIPDPAAAAAGLDAVAEAAAEQSMSMDPADPPPRGEPVDGIRREAGGDQVRAANLVERQPAGYARARAWLAMAKAQVSPPGNLNDYMAAGSQPADPGNPGDLPPPGDSLPPGGEPPAAPAPEQ